MDKWQPIETAPRPESVQRIHAKTGKPYTEARPVRILAALDGVVYPSRMLVNGRFEGFTKASPPTHWMAFPSPPQMEEQKDG